MPDPDTLIQRYLEQALSPDEAAQLHEMLKADPRLGERLLGQFETDAMLRATRASGALATRPMVLLPRRRFSFATVAGVAAMAACLTLVGAWLVTLVKRAPDEATTASVAVLSRAVNLVWETEAGAPVPGAALSPGVLKLKSGLAQIEFYQGARVLIEGPATIELISSGEALCSSGRLIAHVPEQAKGFGIRTPQGKVVDLGTEFAIAVDASDTEVHVFKGKVEVQSKVGGTRALGAGEAVQMADLTRRREADASVFGSLTDLDVRTAASLRTQFEHWQQLNARRNDDPALRLHLDFQDMDELRSLQNHALNRQSVPDASIVGCAWTEGRWPGKRALEFRTVSDRVRLSVPGLYPVLTMTAWVRVSGLDRAFNSLFMCEGWGNRKVHWQITRDGKVRFGAAADAESGARFVDCDSPPLFTPERFGRWTHLALVFDAGRRLVQHYVDGKLVAGVPMPDSVPVRLGVAELGNWNNPGHDKTAIRNLSGAMDEFALYARALSAQEIAEMAK